MVEIELKDIEVFNALCNLCYKYKNEFNVDIVCGSYSVDGNSVLGVLQLLGHTVKVIPLARVESAEEYVEEFTDEVKKIKMMY